MPLSNSNIKFYNIGISYKKADAHLRGLFSLSKENQILLLNEAKERNINGIFIISTCNRTEINGFAEHPFQLISLLCKYSKGSVEEFAKISFVRSNYDAITHLFRLGAGLESQILGDYEIVGQLKLAFKQAKQQNTTNGFLERLFNSVLQASKRVKNETQISSGTTSVSYVAVQYIINNVLNYNNKNILIYGLGKMGKHTSKNLVGYTNNKNICLINRTNAKVENFLENINANIRCARHEYLNEEIAKTDILIVSTAADKPTITKANLPNKKPLLIIDLSIPENVAKDVKMLEGVTLINVDELSAITDETLNKRKQEIPKAEAIIELIKNEFNTWLDTRRFVPTIKALKNKLENLNQTELQSVKKELNGNFNEQQAEMVSAKIIQKITNQFANHLREDNANSDSIALIKKVFQLDDSSKDA